MSRETCVRWLGMNAVYAEPERAILAALPVREQAFLHTLKAFMEGTIEEGCRVKEAPGHEQESPLPTSGHGLNNGTRQGAVAPTVYTDPEDIPFGDGAQTPRKRPVYALVCTWQQSCQVPTKREGEFWARVWKIWYEWQGWKVSSHATGYFARHPSGQSHSISLHEYDPVSKERLR